jgi:rare lipoprotein A
MMSFVQLTTLFFLLFTATSMPAAASINPNADAGDGRRYDRSHRASILEGSGQIGMASYYWQPQRLASGGQFNPNAMTAAHKTLPFGTRVRVKHLHNGRSVDVLINDRGPYTVGRVIDLSRVAAGKIGMTGQGVSRISMTVLGR